jgi:phosphomethylpyrimidine synthase
MKSIKLKSNIREVYVGDSNPIIVNCNVGINDKSNLQLELDKIDALFSDKETTPDTMMDLSICKNSPSIAKYIIDKYSIPVGIVPVYSICEKDSINKEELIHHIIKNAEDGVAFMTMHFTADKDIYEVAKRERKIPVTSRGGSIVLHDMFRNNRNENIYRENINEIVKLANTYNFVISLGTTFRPAGIVDACDTSHIIETMKQIELCHYFQSQGVNVIVENVGHISLDKIATHSALLKKMNAPIMPLGPIVIDSAIGNDHIASAIGAAFMGYQGCAHIINAISPSEHLTSLFSVEDTKNAIIAAKIAAKSVNVNRFPELMFAEEEIYNQRSMRKSCLINDATSCYRCDKLCPLKM